jgi:23S rRNA (cytidine2498-2'-O)-methyltransferase
VADVVMVDDAEWWVGYHRVQSLVSSWPGGFCESPLPSGVVSRAYLKMHEALLWSEFLFRPGERCVEIGSAPGGASQFLLAQGLDVAGIDPAEMDPVVLADPHFRHIRKRSKEVPRSEFVGIDWLTCDVNLPPNYTLDTVKAIVSHPGVKFQGMLLTLKLVDWSLAEDIPKYLDRIRSFGFRHFRARQLHHNRQEICVAASGFRAVREKPARARQQQRSGDRGQPQRIRKTRKHLSPLISAKKFRKGKKRRGSADGADTRG